MNQVIEKEAGNPQTLSNSWGKCGSIHIPISANLFRLKRNVPSDAPFTLNKQLTTSSVEQFSVKFMVQALPSANG